MKFEFSETSEGLKVPNRTRLLFLCNNRILNCVWLKSRGSLVYVIYVILTRPNQIEILSTHAHMLAFLIQNRFKINLIKIQFFSWPEVGLNWNSTYPIKIHCVCLKKINKNRHWCSDFINKSNRRFYALQFVISD